MVPTVTADADARVSREFINDCPSAVSIVQEDISTHILTSNVLEPEPAFEEANRTCVI